MQTQYPNLEKIRELLATAEDARKPASYARTFEKTFEGSAGRQWILENYEQDLWTLDAETWRALKASAVKRLMRNKGKDWEPLFDILSEAKGYAYLKALGCADIQMIPTSYDYKTPDLKAMLNGGLVLCEVKTINMSDDARTVRDIDPGSPARDCLAEDFLRGKLTWTLRAAKAQLDAVALPAVRRLVYLVFTPDESLDGYADDYALQLKAFVKTLPMGGVEVEVFQFPQHRSGAPQSIQTASAHRA